MLTLGIIGGSGARSPLSALDLPPLRPAGSPRFTADLVVALDPEGRPRLAVTVSLPYRELQWIKVRGGFAARAEFIVVFQPRRRGIDHGDTWVRDIAVERFESTTSSLLTLVERRTFDLAPGPYEFRVQLRDAQGEQVASVRERLDVPDFSKARFGFADLEIGVVDSAGLFVPAAARKFGRNVSRLAARVALYDRRAGAWPRSYPFRYRILDEGGGEVRAGRREVTVERSTLPVVIRPDSTELFLGGYVFEVEVLEGRSRWRVERSFEVEESGPPRGRDFEQILEPLAFIAESGEIEHLRSLKEDEQPKGWEEFWARRDPTPDTPRNEALIEFFRRIRHVEKHFQGFGPGWRSDMGRVYIKHGAPEQVENRPETSQGPQVEVWYYARPYRRFVFVDREGFGRYVLVSPSLE